MQTRFTTSTGLILSTVAGMLDGVLQTLENIDGLRNKTAPAYVIPDNIAWTTCREICRKRGYTPPAFV